MTIPSIRPSSGQTRLAWALVIMGALVGAALWIYNLSNISSSRRAHRHDAAGDVRPEPPPAPLDPPPVARIRVPTTEIPANFDDEPDAATAAEPPPPPPPEEPPPPPPPRDPAKRPPPERPPPERVTPREPDTQAGAGTLLVIAASAEAEGVEVVVDGHMAGTVPLRVEVTGGLHEVRLRRPNGPSMLRYVYVPAGESRRLIVPRLE